MFNGTSNSVQQISTHLLKFFTCDLGTEVLLLESPLNLNEVIVIISNSTLKIIHKGFHPSQRIISPVKCLSPSHSAVALSAVASLSVNLANMSMSQSFKVSSACRLQESCMKEKSDLSCHVMLCHVIVILTAI